MVLGGLIYGLITIMGYFHGLLMGQQADIFMDGAHKKNKWSFLREKLERSYGNPTIMGIRITNEPI